jgi:hypothetical protein
MASANHLSENARSNRAGSAFLLAANGEALHGISLHRWDEHKTTLGRAIDPTESSDSDSQVSHDLVVLPEGADRIDAGCVCLLTRAQNNRCHSEE